MYDLAMIITARHFSGGRMPEIAKVLVFLLLAAPLSAADSFLGIWKSNPAKSDHKADVTVTYTKEGDWFAAVIVGTDPRGTKVTRRYRFKIDGNEYAIETPFGPAKVAFTKIDDYNIEGVGRIDSGERLRFRMETSKDGKSRTVRGTRWNANGEQFNDMAVYDRQ
jgi:hypothetical protein